jgi:alpha-L-rhamnosidase
MLTLSAVALSVLAQADAAKEPAFKAVDLRCEYRVNPLGMDVAAPMLSWRIETTDPKRRNLLQRAFRVRMATDADLLLKENRHDLWMKSGDTPDHLNQVLYDGPALHSGQRVWWQVQVVDENGNESAWSEPAWFEMGLLHAEDWTAKWLAKSETSPADEADFFKEDPAPVFQKEFALDKPVRSARLYVTGLGYYEAAINGKKVGDRELDPGWTSYVKRTFYSAYDVTADLTKDHNRIDVTVGNGWFNPLPMHMWNKFNLRDALTVGTPRCLLQLVVTYADGSKAIIATDETWKGLDSPILKNSVYLGEWCDARREAAGAGQPASWTPVVVTENVPLEAEPMPPIRVTEKISPVAIKEQTPGVFIVDFGVNMAGRARLHCKGPAGARIQVRYGELLHPDGSLNPMTSVCGQIKNHEVPEGSEHPVTAWQCDTYILKGVPEGEEYAPRFTFHGFRYAEVTGWPGALTAENIVAERLHTDVTPAGHFECSNERFNRIQEACVRTLRSNLHSVQSDCPHREKFGYGGDLVADSELGIYNFDMAAFYRKVVRDFADAVRPNGGFTETAPFAGMADGGLGEQSGPIGWGSVHPWLLDQLYRYYGDIALVREQYAASKAYIDLLERSAQDNIIAPCIGDHESLEPKQTELTSTAFYYQDVRILQRLAALLDKKEDVERFAALATRIRAAFIQHFVDADTGRCGTGAQANQAFALQLGLLPDELRPKALQWLVSDIKEKHNGHLSTGIFGTKFMLHALGDADPETAYALVNQKDFPGWGHMLENGATTLWEHWEFSDNTFSHNHPMFGSVSEYFYQYLAGIRLADDACGANEIIIKPQPAGDLKWVKASYDTLRGQVAVDWRIARKKFTMTVTIPPNTQAAIYAPYRGAAEIRDDMNGKMKSTPIAPASDAPGYARYTVGSGTYTFKTNW